MYSYARSLGRISAIVLVLAPLAIAGNDLKPEEILQRHLDSIGTSEARAAAKSRVVEGTATYRILVGGSGSMEGKAVCVSEGNKMQLLLKVTALQYHGERFMSNGGKTFVEGTYDDHSRSEFGEFLRSEDLPLRDGLLGGTLTTDWALLDLESRKGKLKYQGHKKMDGTDLIAMSYQPKRNSGLDVTLYFDPETFRHVRTVYRASQHAGLDPTGAAAGDEASARQQQTRYQIEERFSDFKTADGLTLPSNYDLRFTEELQNGFTKTVEWTVATTRVLNGVPLDPKNFVIP